MLMTLLCSLCRHVVVQLKVTAALVPPAAVWVVSARTERLSAAEKDVKASS